jgi:hypothetical protein
MFYYVFCFSYSILTTSKIFGCTEDEVSGLFIIMYNEGLCGLYRSPQVVRVLKQTSPWADHVAWTRNAYIILTRKPFGSRRLVHNINMDSVRF